MLPSAIWKKSEMEMWQTKAASGAEWKEESRKVDFKRTRVQ